jgi:uncharacterized FAD-dependent dehydrogenase
MLRINQLKLPVGHTYEELNTKVFKILRTKEIKELTIVRRSIDARKKPDLFFSYIIDVKVADEKERNKLFTTLINANLNAQDKLRIESKKSKKARAQNCRKATILAI